MGRCLLKEPALRYESMAQLDEDLARLQAGEEPLAVTYLLHSPETPEELAFRLRGGEPRRQVSHWPRWTAAGGVLSLLGLAWALATSGNSDWWLLASGAGAATSTAPRTTAPSDRTAPSQTERYRTVALVVSPIDAHVFQGERDLGMMPINVRIREGQRVELTVQRRNYRSRSVIVDGSESRIVVQLSPLPGRSGPALEGSEVPLVPSAPVLSGVDAGPRARSSNSAGEATNQAQQGPMRVDSNAPMRGPVIDLSDLRSTPAPPGPPPREGPVPPSKSVKLPPPPPTRTVDIGADPPGPKPVEPNGAEPPSDGARSAPLQPTQAPTAPSASG